MKKRPFVFFSGLLLLLFPFKARALVELGGDFSYDRQIYGEDRQNKLVDRTYSAQFAWYMFSTTALEMSYSESEQISTQNNEFPISGTTVSVISVQNTVETNVFGVGLRQSLVPKEYKFRPMVSLGYARQFVQDKTHYTFEDNNGTQFTYDESSDKKRYDSASAAFMLQWQIGSRFALKGSIRTIFEAFKFNSAKDNLKYSAGFSIYL